MDGQGAQVHGVLGEGGGQGASGEGRGGDQVKGGDSGPGVTSVSIKKQELSVSTI